jgi:hypothetical protein
MVRLDNDPNPYLVATRRWWPTRRHRDQARERMKVITKFVAWRYGEETTESLDQLIERLHREHPQAAVKKSQLYRLCHGESESAPLTDGRGGDRKSVAYRIATWWQRAWPSLQLPAKDIQRLVETVDGSRLRRAIARLIAIHMFKQLRQDRPARLVDGIGPLVRLLKAYMPEPFACSKSQLYVWESRYRRHGPEALIDSRGGRIKPRALAGGRS